MAAATAPVEVAAVMLEPPEPDSAPVPVPNDVGTPAPAERSAYVQEETPGPRVAQQETPGPRVARLRAPGPRWAQQGSPGTVPVYRENLQGKDRQEKVAEPPGQLETETLARDQEKVWRRCRGNPTRQRRRVGRSGRGER